MKVYSGTICDEFQEVSYAGSHGLLGCVTDWFELDDGDTPAGNVSAPSDAVQVARSRACRSDGRSVISLNAR